MTSKVEARIPAGMRDILPPDMIKRDYVLGVVRQVFEKYGYEPMQTSALELTETMAGKYGEDAERLIYKAWYGDSPAGEFSLRYDLSVPLCRLIAMNANDLTRPFKRYQIAPVYRADRPQKGRYREFYQCDIDVVGSESMLADAEIIAVIYEVLNTLGFTAFTISINNRKILDGIGQYVGVPDNLRPGLYRSIDKLDKIGLEGVRRELLMVGVPTEFMQAIQKVARLGIQGKVELDAMRRALVDEGVPTDLALGLESALHETVEDAIARAVPSNELQAETRAIAQGLAPELREFYNEQADQFIPMDVVDKLLDLLQISGPVGQVLDDLEMRLKDSAVGMEGLSEMRDLFYYTAAFGVPEDACALNFAMVRGLEYYTGPILETTVSEPKAMPSICGGGRYDGLIGRFGDVDIPATGGSLGIERIIDVMDELDMFPDDIKLTTSDVLVTVFDASTAAASLDVVTSLRQAGINSMIYFEPGDRLGDQLGYASSKGIPFVVIIGPDELATGKATIRKLGKTKKDSEQREVDLASVAAEIASWT
ncbi:MAG: histidine--tRNA ligase [Chloroflexi bacterium]|nr:histidine--tRNA ligase [Chloroflexota bacterium]